ncbi:MAG: 30S ribosomal protein S17e [Candidatus Altiarchaeota archaeon]
MGRIKQTYLKRVAVKLLKDYPQDFNADFQKNKSKIQEHLDIGINKRIRNKIAGTITRLYKVKEKAEV